MYNWNIELVEKVRVAAWSAQWLAMFLVLLPWVFGYKPFLAVAPILMATMRATYLTFKEHNEQKRSPSSAPNTTIGATSLRYSEGTDKYQIEIPYQDIIKISHANIIGFHRIRLILKNNQALTIWNMKNANELASKISSACNYQRQPTR